MNTRHLIGVVGLAVAAVGCGGLADEGGSKLSQEGNPGADDPAVDPAVVQPGPPIDDGAESECVDGEASMPIFGRRVNETERCAGAREFAGCGAFAWACDDAMTYARSPSGDLWEFPSGCTPSGWPVVYPDHPLFEPGEWLCTPEHPEPIDCVQVDPEDCWQYSAQCISLVGLLMDEVEHCAVYKETVGCEPIQDCSGLAVYARSPAGDLWAFGNRCSPSGWEIEEPETGLQSFCFEN